VQRSHTLPFVLTLGAACGSGGSGPKAAPNGEPNVDKAPTVITMPTVPFSITPIDAAVPYVPPPDLDLPKLACDAGTSLTQAPYPDPTWFCARADGVKHGPFFTLFPDEQIEIEGRYKDGKLDGAWKRHFHSGAIAEEGAYLAGQLDGEWRQLDESGNVLGTYKLKKGTGKQKKWLDDGPLYSDVTLVKGVPHGPMKIYDREGHLVVAAKFYMGRLDGDHVVGWKNTLRIEEKYNRGTRQGPRKIWQFWSLVMDEAYDRGKLEGTFTLWRDDKKQIPRVVGMYDHGKKIGDWVWTDKNNKTEREGAFLDGKKNGVWTEFTDDIVTFTGSFTDGKPDGDFVYNDLKGNEIGRFTITAGTGTMLTFHSNKKPSSRAKMFDGKLQGKYEELTPRGKVIVEGYYSSDKKHGSWREWTETGVPTLEQHWKRGKLDGAVKKFDDAGKVAVEATYKDGKVEGTYTEYRDGKPSLVGQFTADKRTGTWTSYDKTGAVRLTASYKDGVLDGPWKQVSEGATTEGTMVAGRRSGTWTRTDQAGTVTTTTVKTP
jgi:antitoxin component YwqK of YwqJK toxin-antitoxin module